MRRLLVRSEADRQEETSRLRAEISRLAERVKGSEHLLDDMLAIQASNADAANRERDQTRREREPHKLEQPHVQLVYPSERSLSASGIAAPPQYICPITLEIMRDPVTTADGQAYERAAIERWLLAHDTSPLTGMRLHVKHLSPAIALRQLIASFMSVTST